MCVLPYKYCKISEMLLKLMESCELMRGRRKASRVFGELEFERDSLQIRCTNSQASQYTT